MGRILIVAPHADDEIIGCGGMMAKRDDEIHVVIATVGNPIPGAQVHTALREEEMYRAHALLHVKRTTVLYPDRSGFLDEVPMFDYVGGLDEILREGYDEVYYPADCHMHDHHITYKACRAALRPGTKRAPFVAEYEHNWPGWNHLEGNYYVNITGHLQMKLNAMRCYDSQLYRHSLSRHHPLSIDAIERVAAMRGLECGVRFAERYRIVYSHD